MLAAPSIGCAFANCSVACSGEHVDVAFPFDARVKGNVACGLARMRPVHFEHGEGGGGRLGRGWATKVAVECPGQVRESGERMGLRLTLKLNLHYLFMAAHHRVDTPKLTFCCHWRIAACDGSHRAEIRGRKVRVRAIIIASLALCACISYAHTVHMSLWEDFGTLLMATDTSNALPDPVLYGTYTVCLVHVLTS